MSDPKEYDLTQAVECNRLLHEVYGYMKTSRNHGTDTEGRDFAIAALGTLSTIYTAAQVTELLRRERERCAKVCDAGYYADPELDADDCASAIRALPDEVQP